MNELNEMQVIISTLLHMLTWRGISALYFLSGVGPREDLINLFQSVLQAPSIVIFFDSGIFKVHFSLLKK